MTRESRVSDLPGYLQTGQHGCYAADGEPVACRGSGQDGEFRKGLG